MGMGFAPTWLRQVRPLLHMTTLTTECSYGPTHHSRRLPDPHWQPLSPVLILLCLHRVINVY